MRTIKIVIALFLTAVAVLAVVGTANLRSQERYAAKMNAPALVTNSAMQINPVVEQKIKNPDL